MDYLTYTSQTRLLFKPNFHLIIYIMTDFIVDYSCILCNVKNIKSRKDHIESKKHTKNLSKLLGKELNHELPEGYCLFIGDYVYWISRE